MKKTYAAPAVVSSGGVVANTMFPGVTPIEETGISVAGAVGFYL